MTMEAKMMSAQYSRRLQHFQPKKGLYLHDSLVRLFHAPFKVGDLDDHSFTDQEILRFQISMDDSLSVDVFQAIYDLLAKVAQFWQSEGAAVTQELKKVVWQAHFESETSAPDVVNLPQKLDNICVAIHSCEEINFALDLW